MRPPTRIAPFLAVLVMVTLAFAASASSHPFNANDRDNDGWENPQDNCPDNYDVKQKDTDKDTAYFPAPIVYHGTPYGQHDGSAMVDQSPGANPPSAGGDACDIDDDNDGLVDVRDNCRLKANRDQADADGDGIGDVCDQDRDGDGIDNDLDNCPLLGNPDQADANHNGVGDACDPSAPRGRAGGVLKGANPNDRTPPSLRLTVPRVQRYEAVQGGLVVPVNCSEGCIVESRLMLAARAARRVGVSRRASAPVVLAEGTAVVEEKGSSFLFVHFSKGALARLQRAGRTRPVLKVTVTDASGNHSSVSRTITLRR